MMTTPTMMTHLTMMTTATVVGADTTITTGGTMAQRTAIVGMGMTPTTMTVTTQGEDEADDITRLHHL